MTYFFFALLQFTQLSRLLTNALDGILPGVAARRRVAPVELELVSTNHGLLWYQFAVMWVASPFASESVIC